MGESRIKFDPCDDCCKKPCAHCVDEEAPERYNVRLAGFAKGEYGTCDDCDQFNTDHECRRKTEWTTWVRPSCFWAYEFEDAVCDAKWVVVEIGGWWAKVHLCAAGDPGWYGTELITLYNYPWALEFTEPLPCMDFLEEEFETWFGLTMPGCYTWETAYAYVSAL